MSVAVGGLPQLRFTVDGPPRGQPRPRFSRWGTHRSPEHLGALDRIWAAWQAAGSPALRTGPYSLDLRVRMARPAGHTTVRGNPSAEALRTPWPLRRPDLSNVAKLYEDALVECGALPSDAHVVTLVVTKRWAAPDEAEGVTLTATSLVVDGVLP